MKKYSFAVGLIVMVIGIAFVLDSFSGFTGFVIFNGANKLGGYFLGAALFVIGLIVSDFAIKKEY